MQVHYPTDTESATSDYVLSVIREEHRQLCQFDDAVDPDAVLSPDSTVADWRDACDLLPWRQFGQAYNTWWGIECTDSEWRSALEPAREKRLSDVCELVAGHALRHRIRPAQLLGRTCNEAGAFLTIRSLLIKAGADERKITPSAPLAPITRRYFETFLGSISRLAPGALPPVRFDHPIYDSTCWLYVVSMLLLLIGAFADRPFAIIAGVALVAFSYAMTWIAASMLPTAVTFGSLQTFRDLAKAIAEQHGD